MIEACFRKSGGKFTGFSVTGHAEYDDEGLDIVCAGVSSAVMLTVNTITDVFKIKADVSEEDNLIALSVSDITGGKLVEALYRHLRFLSEDYPENITVKISEV